MRYKLAILLAASVLVTACDRIEAALDTPSEPQANESSPRPATIDFEVDGDGVYYATRGTDGKIHNAQTMDDIPIAERGTTFVYVDGATPELRGREQRYVANLADASPGDRLQAELREPTFVKASESAGLSGAKSALHVRRVAQGHMDETPSLDAADARTKTFRRGSASAPPREDDAPAETTRQGGIKIESVGGGSETNSLGFGNSKSVGWRPVTIYYADWCGVCTRAMNWMDENDVSYTPVDIEASDANQREMVEFCRENNRSPNSVPTLRIGDDAIMKGWSVSRFRKLAKR